MTQEQRQCFGIDLQFEIGMRKKRLEFRAEQQGLSEPSIEQRLFADTISSEMQDASSAIPQCDRKHSVGTLQGLIQSPCIERRQQDLGIRVPPKYVAGEFQFFAQRLIVVDLGVETQHVA